MQYPGKSSFHHPSSGQDLKSFLIIGSQNYLSALAPQFLQNAVGNHPGIRPPSTSPYTFAGIFQVLTQAKLAQQAFGTHFFRCACRADSNGNQQALGIGKDIALAAFYPFPQGLHNHMLLASRKGHLVHL
jgi:hypothetical protein